MELKKKNVLFVLRATNHAGTEKVVVQLCKALYGKVNKIVICASDGFNTENLLGLNIKFICIPDIENKSISNVLSVFKILKTTILNEKIDIVHCHHRMATFYAKILQYRFGMMVVSTAHNTFTDKKTLTKYIYKNTNVIACGEAVKENLVSFYGIPEKNVVCIHNSVEEMPYEQKKIDNTIADLKNAGSFVVANVGRLTEQKGFEYYLKACQIVNNYMNNVSFLVVGDGELKEKLIKLAKELCIDDKVHFLGYRYDIQNIISQVDLLVLSSLWEGLPLTPIEAFSVGKTVVATNVDGTSEVIIDSYNGKLVPAKDIKLLADSIVYILRDKEVRKEYEKNAKNTYEKKFSFKVWSNQISEYYKSLCER